MMTGLWMRGWGVVVLLGLLVGLVGCTKPQKSHASTLAEEWERVHGGNLSAEPAVRVERLDRKTSGRVDMGVDRRQ